MAGVAVVISLLIVSSAWGQDDHFPFAPFRMYSTTTERTGAIAVVKFYAVTTAGEEIEIPASDLGVRRAEILGRADELRKDPSNLSRLARRYAARSGAPRLVSLSLVYGIYELEDARPVDYSEKLQARWSAG